MRVNGDVTSCSTGALSFPIAVKLNPRVVDFHRPLTVRLAYEVSIPGAGTNAWEKTGVAAALDGS